MRRIGWWTGLALVALTGTAPAAVTWTCDKKAETVVASAYIVASVCSASGTYTTGGDAVTAAALCGSGARQPLLVMVSSSANAVGASTFVATYDQTTGGLMLATAAATPAPGTPLAQVAAGTSVTGFTLRALAFCK
jgi:hypothetical protein